MRIKKKLPQKFYDWQFKYSQAKTNAERIMFLEQMLLSIPRDDLFNKVRSHTSRRLKELRLKTEKERLRDVKAKSPAFNKDLPTIGLIGFANSGKTALINELCNTNYPSSALPFETKEPVIGVFDYFDIKIQLIEIPSSLEAKHIQHLRKVNLVLMLKDDFTSLISKYDIKVKSVLIKDKPSKDDLWHWLDMLRVYSPKSKEPTVLPNGSTVKDFVIKLRKEWVSRFVSAKVTGKSAKYPKQEVGLNHKLKDKDLVELKLK